MKISLVLEFFAIFIAIYLFYVVLLMPLLEGSNKTSNSISAFISKTLIWIMGIIVLIAVRIFFGKEEWKSKKAEEPEMDSDCIC